MNLERYVVLPTVQAIYDSYVARRKGAHRPHLGGSQIGNKCSRALWYQFRWAWSPVFDGRKLRLFETGNLEENRLIADLRTVGVTVWDRDPVTGRQFSYTEAGGHFSLSLDGVVQGLAESEQPHTVEFKTMNAKAFKDVQAHGVQRSRPVYWAQCQIGMYLADLDRCLFLAVEKETDAIYGERIKLDKAEAMKLIAKAKGIIDAKTPPARMSEDPTHFECKWCPYYAVCHGYKVPEVNCRTCAHSTPEANGTWSCARHGTTMDDAAQRAACEVHLFIPQAMPPGWEVRDASDAHVDYVTDDGEIVTNARNSPEIFAMRMTDGS